MVHEICARRWFTRRGNGVCELCVQPAFVLPPEVLKEIAAREEATRAAGSRRLVMVPTRSRRDVSLLLLRFLCIAGFFSGAVFAVRTFILG